jgi:putative ABC transport system permease protein
MEALMTLLVIAAAATTLTVALALNGVTNNPYQLTRQATAGPDVVAIHPVSPTRPAGSNAPISVPSVASLIAAPGVIAHSGPYPTVFSTVRFRGRRVDVVAEGRDQAPASVDQPNLTQGGWIRPGAVLIERRFADALGVHVGDNVRIGGRSFRVAGIAVTAAIPADPSSLCHITCPFQTGARATGQGVPNMGLVWLTRSAVAGLAGSGAPLTYLLNLKLANPAQASGFVAQYPMTFSWQTIQSADNALIGIEHATLVFGAWLIGLLALAGLAVLVGRRMTEQSKRVGLLKAVGATPITVAGVLLFEHIALALAGATVGLVAGWLIAPLLTSTGSGLVGSPGSPSISVSTVVIVAVVALAVAAISSLLPAIRAARASTVSALADAPRVPSRRPLIIAVSARLPVVLLLALRQLSRRPRRAP